VNVPDPLAAELIVHRPPNPGMGEQYPMTIAVDGRDVALLAPGATATLALEPGPHRLRVGNTLFRSAVEFEAVAGERLAFEVRNRRNGATELFALLGAGMWSIVIDRRV
jgi:hypothetical protein